MNNQSNWVWRGTTTAMLASCLALGTGCGGAQRGSTFAVVEHASRKTLTAFGSEQELETFLKSLAQARRRQAEASYAADDDGGYAAEAPMADMEAAEPAAKAAAADGAADESVTNVQHAGVDEGGIVKVHGDHLVVLRRGRLFTVRIGGDQLTPVSMVDAFGPGIDPGGTWYDEMLLGRDTVVVIGYSYDRGGTELGLFDIDGTGRLTYRSTYHLRSNDYYSSRNYASRLIGDKLIFYTPLYLELDEANVFRSFPAMRKWHAGAQDSEFLRIASAPRVYRPILATEDLALHTVTVCDLASRELSCQATAVFGPEGRVFYVSPDSVFVWTTAWDYQSEADRKRSLLYRMPLNGGAPSVLGVVGSPVDQFSFLDRDGFLNVLVRSEGSGDGMWAAEVAEGAVALMRTPLGSFSDGRDQVPRSAYRLLPTPEGYTFQNRYVGSHLLYGTGSGWGAPEQGGSAIYAYRYGEGGDAVSLPLPHGVDRIEALGRDAVVIGTDGKSLHFSPLSLSGAPRLAPSYQRQGASQGELRSHGFFYKPDGPASGLLGLPIREAGRPGFEHLFTESASLLFVRNQALQLTELGTLVSRPDLAADDSCRASCVDWYGNARPLFLRNRVFALLGYEVVEGELSGGRIQEKRRISFAPRPAQIAR